ncbi:MAG: hypothetical protein AB8G05_18215 [Oligoflexales bacterium]
MIRTHIIVIISQFLVFCSADLERKNLLTSTNAKGTDIISDLEDEDEEEITAVPPTVISGAYLACQSQVKNEEEQTLDISCSLKRDGKVLKDLELLDSDISIIGDNGENLILSFLSDGEGVFLFTLVLNEASNIKISLERIGGVEIEREDESDFEDLMNIISIEEIVSTMEINANEVSSPNPEVQQPENIEELAQLEVEESSQEEPTPPDNPEELVTDCNSIAQPGNWVMVPGDSDYGTSDFCVMKYEAKCSLANGRDCEDNINIENPVSQPEGTPWVRISQLEAISECSALGDGFHLITNPEWMTIATNATNVGLNWSGAGVVGVGELARGHSDDSPSNPCQADTNDLNSYLETDCAALSTGEFNQRRTHVLSNGEVVWDLAGNVREWVDYYNRDDKPTPNTDSYSEYNTVTGTLTTPLTDLIPTNAVKSFWDDNWDSSQSIGKFYSGLNSSGGALIRGGDWSNDSNSGLFYTRLYSSQTSSNTYKGFRCVFTLP